MPASAEVVRRATEIATQLFAQPPRQQVALFEGLVKAKDRKFGTPLEKLRKYAERNDPHAFVRDVLGIEPTQQQDELLEIFEKKDAQGRQVHRRILVHAGTDIGKTLVGSCWIPYRAFAVSQLADPDGDPEEAQGAVILLPGPTHPVIADTVWREIMRKLDRATDRGFPLKTMFEKKPRLSSPVDWKPSNQIMFRGMAPEKSKETTVAHATSGRHCANMVAMIEEGAGMREGVWDRLDKGFKGQNNVIVGFLNPDPGEPSGPAFTRHEGGEYLSINMDALDFVNVTERKVIVGGGACTHMAIDGEIRHHCEDLGERTPNASFHDFEYALPSVDEDERGKRKDGNRGMEGCEVHTYRPDVSFVASVRGRFPVGYGDCPFDVASWDASVVRWKAATKPDGPPDRWGIDPALEGEDTAKAAPAWGPSIDDLWSLVYHQQDKIPEILEAGGFRDDVGEWNDVAPIYIGRIESLGSGDGDKVASRAHAICGDVPVVCDKGGEGRSCHDSMKNVYDMKVASADFGSKPHRLLRGEEVPFNRRVQYYLRFARVVKWGLVLIPPDPRLRRQALAQRKDFNHDVFRKVPGEQKPVKVVKMLAKRKIIPAAGGSPDDLEGMILACQRADRGGWRLSTWTKE